MNFQKKKYIKNGGFKFHLLIKWLPMKGIILNFFSFFLKKTFSDIPILHDVKKR